MAHSKTSTAVRLLTETDEQLPPLALRRKPAAKAIGISERLLWSLTSADRIPHCRINRVIVYPVDLLRQWLAQRCERR